MSKSMARDTDQARYVLKQGNVVSINLNELNTEYNLLGFYNDGSVFEHTDETFDTEPAKGPNTAVSGVDIGTESNIITKPIRIKPIAGTGNLVLINDKNIKIAVKKCMDVPQNVLKMFTDKISSKQTPGNLPTATTSDDHCLALNKDMRTYEKKKDKPYQHVKEDNHQMKVNKTQNISFSMLESPQHTHIDPSDRSKLKTAVIKVNEDQALRQISIENINKLLNKTGRKKLIVLKCPNKRQNTSDLPKSDHTQIEKQVKLNSTWILKKPFYIDNNFLHKKELNSTIIDLTGPTNTVTVKEETIDDNSVDWEPNQAINVGECEMRKSDGNFKFKFKQVSVNKQQDNTESLAEMGKIKHFKERTETHPNQEKKSAEIATKETLKEGRYQDILKCNPQRELISVKDIRTLVDDVAEQPEEETHQKPSSSQHNKRKQQSRVKNSNQFIRQEIERCFKATMARKRKLQRAKFAKSTAGQKTILMTSSSQTDPAASLVDSCTQTDVGWSAIDPLSESLHESDFGIIGRDVNFGNGPQVPPLCVRGPAGDYVTYHLGNNLDSFVGNSNVAPSQLVDDKMGYLDVVDNVNCELGVDWRQEKRRFHEYLRNCDVPDSAGNLPLHIGVINNDFEEVKRQTLVLSLRKLDRIDAVNSTHLTPLHLSIIHNCHESIVNFLLDNGADLSCMDSEGNNAIHLAVFCNSTTLLSVLLQRATDTSFNLNTFNHEGFTPLLLATIEDKYDMVKVFLEHGTDANVRDQKSGRTPLFHAVENNNFEMVRLLLENDANKKIKNFSGTSTHDAIFELEAVIPEIKNLIVGKEVFAVNSSRTDKRKRPAGMSKEVHSYAKLKMVKTYMKIKI